jgi:DNA-binding beta-propeller fold protein YncE
MTPTAAPGARYLPLDPGLKSQTPAGFAQTLSLSPDGKTLLALTAGYNMLRDAAGQKIEPDSTQFIFVFDVTAGHPVQRQILRVPNAYVGLAFAPDGTRFYVPGAVDDNVHVFSFAEGGWKEERPPLALGHTKANGLSPKPFAAAMAVTADGRRGVVVNRFNDAITLVDLIEWRVLDELDLRPGKNGGVPGTAGGQYPNSVAIAGNAVAYVTSELDREVVVIDLDGPPAIRGRIAVKGNPNKMTLNRDQTLLYVASDNADVVEVIDTRQNKLVRHIPTAAPPDLLAPKQARYKGASPNGLALAPDERTLYVSNRGTNSLAVIALDGPNPGVRGLIPTGWYPSDVRVAGDGRFLYVSNAKTVPGPNPGSCSGSYYGKCNVPASPVAYRPNDYVLNRIGSALLSVPTPAGDSLRQLTQEVARNNHFGDRLTPGQARVLATLRSQIKHVIYVIKENRSYDQILGDLGRGNGAPALAEFPEKTTPNQHALARQFVTIDHFLNTGDVSGNGWAWSTAGRESDAGAKMVPSNYAGNGGSGDWFGTNRGVNVGLSGAARVAANPEAATLDVDTLPAMSNVAAPDGPDEQVQQGYLWHAALRAGLSVRNYGCFLDIRRYFLSGSAAIALERDPHASGTIVAYATVPELVSRTDPYYRGFDDRLPEFYREQEWEREFRAFEASGELPNLSLVRMMMDHTGSFDEALDGVNTPEIQIADNDHALGRLVQAVARSKFAKDTLIFVVEDDSQDGPDHVDAHRGPVFVVGPYVKKGAVVSTHYTTANLLRTITDILGLDHLGLIDANAGPMLDLFDTAARNAGWTYTASASGLLKLTTLPLPADTAFGPVARPTRDMAYWAAATRQFDFSEEDKLDADAYNRILWTGLMGSKPYPNRARTTKAAKKRLGEID